MRTFSSRSATTLLASCALAASLAASACGNGGSGGSGGTGGSSTGGAGGGPVTGAADKHCGGKVVKVDPATCKGSGGSGGGTGTMTGSDTGTMTGSDTMASEYGETLFNAEGDDDDCKYHVKFSSTAISENKDVTFTLTITNKSDGSPVTGAAPDIEAFLNDIHPAPNTDQKPTDKGMGVYDIGPVKFDAAGKWTVRFHVFEECSDGENSPHGHVAFYLAVP